MKTLGFCSLLLLSSLVSYADAVPVVLDWPADVKSGFVGGIVDGKYLLGPSFNYGFAMSDDGALCTFNPKTSKAFVFPSLGSDHSLAVVKTATVGSTPSAVVFKRFKDKAYFLVACQNDHTVYILDAHDGSVIQKIVTAAEMLNYLAAPARADVPYIYYSGGNAPQGQPGKVGRIDLSKMADDSLIAMPDSNVLEISVSGDGKMLFARRPNTSPTGFIAMGFTEGSRRLGVKVYRNEPVSHPHIFPAPNDDLVASGPAEYSLDLGSVLSRFTFWPLAFSQTQPLMFALKADQSIAAVSLNTRQILSTEPWPLSEKSRPKPFTTGDNPTPPALALFSDDAHGELIVLNYSGLAIISLDDQKIPREKIVRVDVTGDTSIPAGKSWSVKLHKTDPSIDIAVGSAPAGVTVVGDEIRWSPTAADIGIHQITLELTANTLRVEQPLTLTVRRGAIQLPFSPDLLSVSSDGHRALAVQTAGPHHPKGRSDDESSRIVLIDLDHQTIIADRPMLVPLRSAEFDSHFVYVGLRDSSAFLCLSLNDLSDQHRIFTAGPVYRFTPIGDRLFVGVSGKPTNWYALPNMKLDPRAKPAEPYQNSSSPMPIQMDDGWDIRGVVYDALGKSVRWIEQDDFFPTIGRQADAADLDNDNSTIKTAGLWDAQVNYSSIRRMNGDDIFQIATPTEIPPIILPDLPLVAALSRHQFATADVRYPNFVSQIDLFKLATGDRLDPIVLVSQPSGEVGNIRDVPHLVAGGHLLVAQVLDQLYVLPMAALSHEKLPAPFTLRPTEGLVAISTNGPQKIQIKTNGASNPVIFGLAEELPGVSINASTGVLTIDSETAFASAPALINKLADERYRYDDRAKRMLSAPDSLAAYRSAAVDRFKQFTGREPTGYPVALALTILARDSEERSDRLLYTVLYDVPRSAVGPTQSVLAARTTTAPATTRTTAPANGANQNPNR